MPKCKSPFEDEPSLEATANSQQARIQSARVIEPPGHATVPEGAERAPVSASIPARDNEFNKVRITEEEDTPVMQVLDGAYTRSFQGCLWNRIRCGRKGVREH